MFRAAVVLFATGALISTTTAQDVDVFGQVDSYGVFVDATPTQRAHLHIVIETEGVSFTMKGDDVTELGLVAQDVAPFFPDLVKTTSKVQRP